MDGMSGLDLIHEMRRHNINIPAIIVTGYNLVTSEAPVLPKEDIFPKLLESIRAYAPPANESGPSVNTGLNASCNHPHAPSAAGATTG